MTQTLILSPRITPDSEMMLRAAHNANQTVRRLSSYRPPEDLQNQPISVYGEPLFAIAAASGLNHALIEPSHDWLTTLAPDYLQREVIFTDMATARQITAPRFIKNADGLKGFHARVYDSADELPSTEFYPDELPVLVAEPVRWTVEYRCFVLNRQVQTLSVYFRDGEIAQNQDGSWQIDAAQTEEACAYCQSLLDDVAVAVPPAVVVDVGIIDGRGWAVIEANPAYGSGIYGCDPSAVLPVMNRACVPRDQLTDDDVNWVGDYTVDFD